MALAMLALFWTIWALPDPGGAEGLSTNMANMLTVYNGYYDNLAQHESNSKSYDYIQLRMMPVTTPAFPERLVLFDEWSFNGEVLNLLLAAPYEDSDGVIYLQPYNFTDPSLYKPGEYNVEDLSKLTPQDLQPSTFAAEFEPNSPGTYIVTWPACRHYVNRKPAFYAGTLTCDSIRVVIPGCVKETSSALPYHLIRKGDKFPVTNLPDCFVSPCM